MVGPEPVFSKPPAAGLELVIRPYTEPTASDRIAESGAGVLT